ncbi:hypothetical protein LZ30DRAFT_2950 [Colletotrichum cereale]|nr:hypothetical protein LZ30DRAFT_2950 [Colletotrichum cereale]
MVLGFGEAPPGGLYGLVLAPGLPWPSLVYLISQGGPTTWLLYPVFLRFTLSSSLFSLTLSWSSSSSLSFTVLILPTREFALTYTLLNQSQHSFVILQTPTYTSSVSIPQRQA